MVPLPYISDLKPKLSGFVRERSASNTIIEQDISANAMPNFGVSVSEVTKINPARNILPETGRQSMARIFSSRGAPSAVSAEQFLKSRMSFSPEFVHNEASSRISRTSNLYAETPRFRNEIDLLA